MSAVIIPLTKGCVAVVDDMDSDLAKFKWTAAIGKHKHYAQRSGTRINGKRPTIKMHRLIMERMLGRPLLKTELVDHVDNDGFNNRRENLRLANNSQNAANSRKRNGQYKGVSWNKKSEKWLAQIMVYGKTIRLGLHVTPEEAYAAYCEAAKLHFGEFARME